MWVYRKGPFTNRENYAVGFYDPKGAWHEDSVYATKDEARRLVHYLNGGDEDSVGLTEVR